MSDHAEPILVRMKKPRGGRRHPFWGPLRAGMTLWEVGVALDELLAQQSVNLIQRYYEPNFWLLERIEAGEIAFSPEFL